jgi:hypothetical protein
LPVNGSVFIEGRRHGHNVGFVGTSHCMAVHARLGRGHTGMPRAFGVRMTVKAGDLIVPRVQLMGERNGLIRRNA